jgi:glycosyltransferase involved in cell wall biosynthesis
MSVQFRNVNSNQTPYFSLITVVKNGEKNIARCIESVNSQTFKDFEYIIIDGNSTDSTTNIIAQNSDFIDHFVSEDDKGLYYAMNKGLSFASGNYIGILNSDDIYDLHALENIYEITRSRPGASIIYGAIKYLDDQSKNHFISDVELNTKMIYHPAVFVKRSVYLEIGGFNTKYQIAADYDFILRCKRNKEVFFGTETTIALFSKGGYSSKHKIRSVLETSLIQYIYSDNNIFLSFANLMIGLVKALRLYACIRDLFKKFFKLFQNNGQD